MKISPKLLTIVLLTLVVLSSTAYLLLSSEPEGSKPIEETPNQNTPGSNTATPTPVITATVKPEATPASTPTPPVQDKTVYELNSRRLTEGINIGEICTFKNRNSIVYTVVDHRSVSLYEADINEKGNLGQSKLFDKEMGEEEVDFFNLATGNTFDYVLYSFKGSDGKRVVLNDIGTLNRRSIDEGENFKGNQRILFDALDKRLVYSKKDEIQGIWQIVSSNLSLQDEKIIHTVPSAQEEGQNPITWMDSTNDGTKLLYCIEDTATKNPVLWIFDQETNKSRELTGTGQLIQMAKWSPDGKKIVYSIQDGSFENIYVYEVEKNIHVPILSGKTRNSFPDWSYYGDRIFYLDEVDGMRSLYVTQYGK